MTTIGISYHWYYRPQTLGTLMPELRRHLQVLADVCELRGAWGVKLPKKPWLRAIDPGSPDFGDVVKEACRVNGAYGIYYIADERGLLTRSNGPLSDKTLSSFNWDIRFENPMRATKAYEFPKDEFVTSCHVGGLLGRDHSIGVTIPFTLKRLTKPRSLRCIFDEMGQQWKGTIGSIVTNDFYHAVRKDQPEERVGVIVPGTTTYLRVPSLETFLPSEFDCEVLPDGGVVIDLGDEHPGVLDENVVARARSLSAALEDLCLTQSHELIYGWPEDERERAYRHAITGAPPDRFYRVALSDFAGWNAERKVLLWTRMFEPDLQPEQIHYKPTYVRPLACHNYVAEARKQLRSLELAKANVPIEWHCGRPDLVPPLSQLLHGHAGIDPERLRVVATPCMGIPA